MSIILFSPLFSCIVSADEPLSALLIPESEENLDRSTFISYSGDGNILAIAYEKEVYLYHTVSRSELENSPLTLNDFVKSVEFTGDSSNIGEGYLVIGRESIQTNTPAVSIYDLSTNDVNGNWMHNYVEEGIEVSSIVTINGGDNGSFAYATEKSDGKQYIIEYLFSDLNTPLRTIETNHNTDISCLDYDSENNVFISGSDGRVEINIQSGEMIQEHVEPGRQIFDCKYGKDGIYAWSSEDGIKVRESNHAFLQSLTLENSIFAKKIIFDSNLDIMKLLTNEDGNTLVTYSTIGNWNKIDIMIIGHIVEDIDINPTTGEIAASTNSMYISIYTDDWIDPGVENSPSNDLDHDGIDDIEDADRDGDGIKNEIDIVCESTTPCNLVADTEYIRNIEVTVDESNLIISETIFFSIETSQALRLLAAESVDEDGYIEPEERTLFNNAFCTSIDSDLVANAWYGIVTFDNNSLIAGSDARIIFACDGLTNLAHDASSKRVSLSWSISFELAHQVSSNYTLSFKSPPSLNYGMPTNLVHSYPIHLVITDPDIKTYTIEYWFDTTASFDLEFIGVDDDSGIEIAEWVEYMQYASYVLFSIAFVTISVLIVIRYRNRFSIDELTTKKKSPPPSKRNQKEYDYYNPGKRGGDEWNYGDDGEYYYSESYTNYDKASDSVKKSKVRKVKVDSKKIKKEEKTNRRRIVRKKNEKAVEKPVEKTSDSDINEEVSEPIEKETKNIDEVKQELQNEFKEDENKDPIEENEIMDDALSRFFS
jgi:hypothetical protein